MRICSLRNILTKITGLQHGLKYLSVVWYVFFSDAVAYPQHANNSRAAVHFGAGKHMIMISPSQLTNFGKVRVAQGSFCKITKTLL